MDTSKIRLYVKIGKKDKDWYADCERVFVDLFGRDRLDLVTKLFAATSINTSLKSNITLFRKALYEIQNDLPVGQYLPNIKSQIEKIRRGEELSGRKIRSFARAMSGDKNAVVVDIWLLRAFDEDRKYFRNEKEKIKKGHSGPDHQKMSFEIDEYVPKEKKRGRFRSGGATDKQYTEIERYVRRRARRMGLEPRELSSIIWAGVRIHTSGDKETHYKEILIDKLKNLFNVI